MKTLNEIMAYLECPRKYSFINLVGVKEDLSKNSLIKKSVINAINKYRESKICVVDFAKLLDENIQTDIEELYNIVCDLKSEDEVKVVLKTYDFSKSVYYNIHQVIEKDNKELKYKVIVLNKHPKVIDVVIPSRTKEQVEEINNLVKGTQRVIDIVEQENLPFIKRPNNISCSSCLYNKECKPICFEREDEEEN